MPDDLELPEAIMAELRAAAGRVNEWDGPEGRQFQLWVGKRPGAMVLAELYPDGSVEIWRPMDETNSIAATVAALRAYLADAETDQASDSSPPS